MLQKGLEGMGENLIRAVANEHLLRGNTVAGRDRPAQQACARIGVEAETIRRGGDRSQDARRRSVGILVGIKLENAIELWLFAGHVRRQAVDEWTPEAAHDL